MMIVEEEEVEKSETNPIIEQNPLMIEDILDKIFPYFHHDSSNLCTFRLVNHTWNNSACRTIKQNLVWRIGVNKSRAEAGFLRVMSNCQNDLFANFRITQTSKIKNHAQNISKFLLAYGSSISHLQLEIANVSFIKAYLKPPALLLNLTSLKLWGLNSKVLTAPSTLSICKENEEFIYPKLESISIGHVPFGSFKPRKHEGSPYQILCSLLKAAPPSCQELQIINLQPVTTKLLASVEHNGFLSSLTSFSTLNEEEEKRKEGPLEYLAEKLNPIVILRLAEFKNLTSKCTNLKKLVTTLDNSIEEMDIYTELERLSGSLEELNLQRHDIETDSSSEDDDDDDDDDSLTMDSGSDSDEDDSATSSATSSSEGDDDDESGVKVGQGTKRNHDDDEYEDNAKEGQETKKKLPPILDTLPYADNNNKEDQNNADPPRTQFPHFPKLTKLTLKAFHLYNDFDVFNNLPALKHVNLGISSCRNTTRWPIIQPTTGNYNVKYCRLRMSSLIQEKLSCIASAFPALTELDIFGGVFDTELRIIFANMRRLKRLHLNTSVISDAGLTGLDDDVISSSNAHLRNWGQKGQTEAKEWRVHPYIGDLVDLQVFTYNRAGLTHLAIDHGLVDCKNLTYIKVPPYKERPREAYYAPPHYNYTNCAKGSLRAQIIPILRNCPHLVKLDISLTNIVSNTGWKLSTTPTSKTKAALETQQTNLNLELSGGKYNINNMDLQFIQQQQSKAPNYIEILYSN